MMRRAAITLAQVMEATLTLPCAPAILPKLLALIQSDDGDVREMEIMVRTDPGLAAGVIRLANSAYFASSHRCESIAEAILRLGSTTLYRLAATIVAGRWLAYPARSAYGWEAGDLCRHSLCVAVAAEFYAQRALCEASPETAYTAGLLHDVGKLALACSSGRELEGVAALVSSEGLSWHAAEMELLGFSSADVSRELLRRWGFPNALVAVGSFHRQPSQAPASCRDLVVLVHAAKNVAVEIGYGVGADGFLCEPDEAALEACGLDDLRLHDAMPGILDRVQRFIAPDGRLVGIQPPNRDLSSHP